MQKCPSGKRAYPSAQIAEEALIEAHVKFEFGKSRGPVSFYLCEDCGQYHLTSQGLINQRLAGLLKSGELNRIKESNRWNQKFRKS
jgi:hypothetical protein